MSFPYSVGNAKLLEELKELNGFHLDKSAFLSSAVNKNSGDFIARDLSSFFPLPVDYFKGNTQPSVPSSQISTWVSSSGTLGTPSRIPLDIETSTLQSKAAAKTFGSVLGEKRRPLLLIDSSEILKAGGQHSARAAGSLAMIRMSSMHSWLLDEEESRDKLVTKFAHQDAKPFVFGFTFMVFQHLYDKHPDVGKIFEGATLIHGGGWKKLEQYAVGRGKFYRELRDRYGFSRIVDYYGMVEQLGSIWLESPNEPGVFLPNHYSGALIRDTKTLEVISELGRPGLIQLFSTIPRSYPGHSLLTGDLGALEQIDSNGEKIIGLRVNGRMPSLEPRGCSDAAVEAALGLTVG